MVQEVKFDTIVYKCLIIALPCPWIRLLACRDKPKEYDTSRSVEGIVRNVMKGIIIDDIATTGGSVAETVRSLKEAGVSINDTFVVVDRMEEATEALAELDVSRTYPITLQ